MHGFSKDSAYLIAGILYQKKQSLSHLENYKNTILFEADALSL
jgi:hypothetical protein